MSTNLKKMLKIVCPIERKDGTTHWLRVGTAFPNRDNSINLFIDAFPTNNTGKLQLREFDESELRARDGDGARGRGRADAPPVGGALPAEDLPF